MTEGAPPSDKIKQMAKAMFMIGYGDCFHKLMDILTEEEPIEGTTKMAAIGKEINIIMAKISKGRFK